MKVWVCKADIEDRELEIEVAMTPRAALEWIISKVYPAGGVSEAVIGAALAEAGDCRNPEKFTEIYAATQSFVEEVGNDEVSIEVVDLPVYAMIMVSGGVAEILTSEPSDIGIDIMDLDNIRETMKEEKPAINLSDREWAYIRDNDLRHIDADEVSDAMQRCKAMEDEVKLARCQNCNRLWSLTSLDRFTDLNDLLERVAPGEVMPAGECPAEVEVRDGVTAHCGAVCHIVTGKEA